MDISSQEFIDELTKFRDAVIDHAEHEETEEFTKLQRELDADDRRRMASAVQAAEAIAPTRPHPGVESAKLNFARRSLRIDAGPGPRRHRRGAPLISGPSLPAESLLDIITPLDQTRRVWLRRGCDTPASRN